MPDRVAAISEVLEIARLCSVPDSSTIKLRSWLEGLEKRFYRVAENYKVPVSTAKNVFGEWKTVGVRDAHEFSVQPKRSELCKERWAIVERGLKDPDTNKTMNFIIQEWGGSPDELAIALRW
jgi:hypothetical protein